MKAEMSIKVKLKVSHLSATKYVDVGIFKTRTFGDKPTLCLWSQPGSSISTYFFSYATLALPKQAKCKTRIDKIERYKKQGRHKGGKLRKNNYNWNVERERVVAIKQLAEKLFIWQQRELVITPQNQSYARTWKTVGAQVGHSQSLTSNLYRCQRCHSPQKQNLHGGSLIRMGASAGAIAFNVIGASLESCSLQEKLGLFMSWAQGKIITDYKKWPEEKQEDFFIILAANSKGNDETRLYSEI